MRMFLFQKAHSGYAYLLVAVVVTTLVPWWAHAQVVITEIMYDLEGSDAGREWVEVQHEGDAAIDLSAWRFFENEINHSLTPITGDGVLAPGAHAVIADNTEKFRTDYPDFSGALFNSTFSLNNTGETLTLRDADLSDVDTVTYRSEWGANGDGNSLQKSDDAWHPALPTPGMENRLASLDGSSGTIAAGETSTSASSGGVGGGGGSDGSGAAPRDFPVEPQIFADAGPDRAVVALADTAFRGSATGLVGKPLTSARFIWNFGDGETKEGRNVFHYYRYPGTYVAVLNVASGEYAASDRITVTVRPAIVSVTEASPERVVVKNGDAHDLDLSWWLIRSESDEFMVPKNTFLPAHGSLTLASEITGLSGAARENTTLHYPNGVLAYAYEPELTPPRTVTDTEIRAGSLSQSDAQEGTDKRLLQDVERKPFVGADCCAETNTAFPTSTTRAAIHDVVPDRHSLTPWLLALFGVLVLSAIAVVGAKRTKTEAEDYTIIEQ